MRSQHRLIGWVAPKRSVLGVLLAAVLLSLHGACVSAPPSGDARSTLRIPLRVSIDELMVQWINPASYAIWDAARDQYAPNSSADWRRLEGQALQLVASGTLTAIAGTGPNDPEWVEQEDWIEFTRQMTDAAEAALEAARARDLDAFLGAGNALVEPCEACHAVYRPSPGS